MGFETYKNESGYDSKNIGDIPNETAERILEIKSRKIGMKVLDLFKMK